MASCFRLLLVTHPVPIPGAVDSDALIRDAERVVRINFKAPVDALLCVPLLVLALLVQCEQLVATIIIFPAEADVPGRLDGPFGIEWINVEVMSGHLGSPGIELVLVLIPGYIRIRVVCQRA